jgi:DNA gyrase subunit A
MGRQAAGVNAIRLTDDDVVAGMDVVNLDHTHMLVVTRNGFGKRTLLDEYRQRGRYGVGVRTLGHIDKTGPIVAMRCMKESDDILLITREGVVLRTSLDQIRETGRSTQGVTVMKLAEGDEIVGMTLMASSGENGEASSNGAVDASANGATNELLA